MSPRSSTSLSVAVALAAAGCGVLTGLNDLTELGAGPDAGAEASADAPADTSPDARADVSPEAAPDAQADSGDAGADVADADADAFVASRCASAQVELCDGFEAPNVDVSLWPFRNEVGGMVSIDTTLAYRGRSSLHVHGDAVDAGASVQAELDETETFPDGGASGPFFYRAFFYVAVPPPGPPGVSRALFSLVSGGMNGAFFQIVDTGFFAETAGPRTFVSTSFGVPSPVAWVCIELGVDPAVGLSVRVNDVVVPDLLRSTAVPTPLVRAGLGYGAFNLGSAQPAFDYWIDEVIVDGAPIGCAK